MSMLNLEKKIDILNHNFNKVKDKVSVIPHIYELLNDDIFQFLVEKSCNNISLSEEEDIIFNELYEFLYNNEIIGLLTKEEAKVLYSLAQQSKEKQEPAIEIGTHLGFSTIFVAKSKFVYAVDNQFDNKLASEYPTFRHWFKIFYDNSDYLTRNISDDNTGIDICHKFWGIAGVAENIKTFSQDAIKAVDYMPEASIVFYDANHDFDSIYDMDAYFLKVVPGGFFAIHDFNIRTPGVVGATYDFYKRNKDILEGPFLVDSLIWFKKKD